MNPHRRTTRRSLAGIAAASLLVVACSDDDSSSDTTAESATSSGGTTATTDTTGGTTGSTTGTTTGGTSATTTGGSGSAASANLADVCPDPFVIQTDWFPESEHGAIYEMMGDDYEVDGNNKVVEGRLVAGGEDTGIGYEIRAGGPAIASTVAATTYSDDSITLAYANTESQVTQNDETPLVSVLAPLEINPQIIYWDPETYPEVETLADLGEEEITINIFSNSVYAEVFVADGTWSEDQVDPSYDGSPARFVAEDGQIAQQGFASAEPYKYEQEFTEWGKPVEYELIHDAGFEVYSQTLAARADDVEGLSDCFAAFVPIAQQAAIDYVDDPARANAIIIDAVEGFDTFWTYDEGVADFSVETQKELGLVGNGPDDTLGNMDEARIQGVIDQMRDAGVDGVPEDLEAADLFTNEFIDTSIGL
ncbi:MAG: ABC transporter substrate-binding protein [Actinomycetota bacterium]|nr:ABC transporter substrate-binding protein [Actinomycetota bacterium]